MIPLKPGCQRFLALTHAAVIMFCGAASATAQRQEEPAWSPAAHRAANTCLKQAFEGQECRADGWRFSRWDAGIERARPAEASITVLQGVSDATPRKGMTVIVDHGDGVRSSSASSFVGAPEYVQIGKILDGEKGQVLLVTREHFDKQQSDALRLYRMAGASAGLIAHNPESKVQAGKVHLLGESTQGAKSFLALVGDALFLCRGRQRDHSCMRYREIDAAVYASMHDGG
jgi:hypothetical protein